MKAVYFHHTGAPEVLEYGDRPDPVAKPGEILVDIHAASINAADWKVRTGDGYKVPSLPHILGRDFSGVVSALGESVTGIKVGDAVFGVCDVGIEGAYAEKIAIKASLVGRKPDWLTHEQAVAVALTGLTAIVSIEETIKLKPGETILIQGGAGGVAAFAIQIAKHIGARVVTTTSAGNRDYVQGFGPDQIIDYNAEDFTKVLSNVDAVFDTVGGEVADRSFKVIRSGGRAAFIASGAKAPPSPRADVASLRPNVGRDGKYMERIVELVKAGAVKIPAIRTFKLSEAVEAHRISEGRHLRGKLIFKVR